MRIQLYNRGTAQGKQLFANLETICQRLQIDYDPEFITDMNKIYSRGITGETILMINGEPVLIDHYPSKSELENIIQDCLK
jgi:hypothetical protein